MTKETTQKLNKLYKDDPHAWYMYAAMEVHALDYDPSGCLVSGLDIQHLTGLPWDMVFTWTEPLEEMGLLTISPLMGHTDLEEVFACCFADKTGPRRYSRTKEAKDRLAKVMEWGKLTPAGDLAELLTKRATGILPSVRTSVWDLADELNFPPDVVAALLFILARAGFLSYWSPGIGLLRPIDWYYEEGETLWDYAEPYYADTTTFILMTDREKEVRDRLFNRKEASVAS